MKRRAPPKGTAARAAAQLRVDVPKLAQQVSARLDTTPNRNVPRKSEALLPEAPVADPSDLGPIAWPAPAPEPDEAALLPYAARLYAVKAGRQRRYQELVEPTDDVLVSCLGFAEGRPVPFTARYRSLLPADDDRIPGAREAATGAAVGSSAVYPLPADVTERPVRMALEIVEAWDRPALPLDDGDLKAGGFDAVDDLVAYARQQWAAEAALAHRIETRNAVLAALRARHPLAIPERSVDDLLHIMWAASEAAIAERMKVSAEEQQQLLSAWQRSPELRDDARVRLHTSALVRAFGRARQVEPTERQAGAKALSEMPQAPASVRERELGEALLSVPQEGPREAIWYLMALDRLVDEARGS